MTKAQLRKSTRSLPSPVSLRMKYLPLGQCHSPERCDAQDSRHRRRRGWEIACLPSRSTRREGGEMKVIYTYTDEAPALATHSFLPVIEAFAGGGRGRRRDPRHLAVRAHPRRRSASVPDALAELGELATTPEANIIKLPNISASIPQLKAAIAELQAAGYAVPDYPENPQTDEEKAARAAYDAVKGSAVNPVLREGNSDRRAPALGQAVRPQPPALDGRVVARVRVARRDHGRRRLPPLRDVGHRRRGRPPCASSTSPPTARSPCSSRRCPVLEGEIVDAAVMRRAALDAFLAEQIADAKERGVLFSVHLKATMMKVSDPIMFGHAVSPFFADVFAQFGDDLASVGANPNDGLAQHPHRAQEAARRQARGDREGHRRDLRVRPGAGDGRLRPRHHQPARAVSDVIIDASMPAAIRASGQMWNADGRAAGHEVRHPGLVLRAALRRDGRLLPRARRVRPDDDGHHAQRRADGAEGRGVRQPRQDVRDRRPTASCGSSTATGRCTLLEHDVEAGDIWRACQTKDAPVRDWVRARRRAGPGHRRARRLLAGRDPRRTTPRCSRRCAPTSPSWTPTG